MLLKPRGPSTLKDSIAYGIASTLKVHEQVFPTCESLSDIDLGVVQKVEYYHFIVSASGSTDITSKMDMGNLSSFLQLQRSKLEGLSH